MSDITFNRYLIVGTDVQRLAFIPDPADISSIGPGEFLGVFWYNEDTGDFYVWDGVGAAWVLISASGGAGITTLTGDVTAGPGSGSQVATIANDAVTNAKLANMATQTIKGRTTAGTGDPEDLTATQATAILNSMVGDSGAGGTKGLAPAPAAGDAAAGKFLKADGTFAVPPGTGGNVTAGGALTSGQLIAGAGGSAIAVTNLTGDVTTSGGVATTIANDAVTFAKMQNIATDSLIGRDTAATGDPENILLNATLSMDGAGNLQRAALTGDITASAGSNATTLKTAAKTRAITFTIDGGGIVPSTGIKGDVSVPYACTITGARILLDQSGSCVVDIWKDTYANYPPTVADTITASAKPTVSSAVKSEDTTLTGWTTSISAGDTLRFNLDSVSTATRIVLILTVTV